MPRSFSLIPPVVALVVLAVGIGLVSIPAALVVVGGLGLVAWVANLVYHVRRIT